jgi:hypothetical protein
LIEKLSNSSSWGNAMPGTARAPKKRPRARTGDFRKRAIDRALDIEPPLREAAAFVQALRLIGHGLLDGQDEEGRAIATVAQAASERLDAVTEVWDALIDLMRQR